MTLTFGVGISRSFETCPKLSSFDINLLPGLGLLFTAKNYQNDDMIRGSIYSKAVTFDLDLESQKKKWQEKILKPTHETKHDGIYRYQL